MHRFSTEPRFEHAKPLWAAIALAIMSLVMAPASLADQTPPAPVPTASEPSAEEKAPAETAKNSETAAKNSEESKFNPLLIRNNPKAHVYANELRGPVIRELQLVKRLVELSPEEFKTLTEKAQDALFEVAAEYALRHGKVNGGRYYPPPVNIETSEDVVLPVVTRVRKEVAESLSPEEGKRYLEVLNQLDQFRRDAYMEVLVCRLETTLVLTGDQREEISAVLKKEWDPKWEDNGALRNVGADNFPEIPTSLLEPYLDAEQMHAWQSAWKDGYYSKDLTLGTDGQMPADIPWDPERHR
jgi:hypothetical protein